MRRAVAVSVMCRVVQLVEYSIVQCSTGCYLFICLTLTESAKRKGSVDGRMVVAWDFVVQNRAGEMVL